MGEEKEDIVHALVNCHGNRGTGRAVLDCVTRYVTELTDEQAVRLQFDTEESLKLPVVWLWAVSLTIIWEAKGIGQKTRVVHGKCRS